MDTGFWGGVVPGNSGELRPLREAGVFEFERFLAPSGVEEFASVTEKDLREVLPTLASLGVPLLARAEASEALRSSRQAACGEIRAAKSMRHGWHPAHGNQKMKPSRFSCASAANSRRAFTSCICLPRIRIPQLAAGEKAEGLPVSVQKPALTIPHLCRRGYMRDGATPEFKCAPPIRERENREKLWEALGDGTIDLIASDHSPCPPQMKLSETGDFLRAWGGVASLQFSLPAVWTEARHRGYSVTRLAEWLCAAPARLAGLEKRKGSISVGCDADFVIWNPDAQVLSGTRAIASSPQNYAVTRDVNWPESSRRRFCAARNDLRLRRNSSCSPVGQARC